jgi:hypothetical protein
MWFLKLDWLDHLTYPVYSRFFSEIFLSAAILNGHNFERNPPRDHPCQVWFNLVRQFQRRRFIATKLWWNGTWVTPPWKLCPVILTSNQDGHQAKNRKKGGWNLKKNLLLWNYWANRSQPNFAEMMEVRITGHNFQGGGHPSTIPPKFGCNWSSGFWGED